MVLYKYKRDKIVDKQPLYIFSEFFLYLSLIDQDNVLKKEYES